MSTPTSAADDGGDSGRQRSDSHSNHPEKKFLRLGNPSPSDDVSNHHPHDDRSHVPLIEIKEVPTVSEEEGNQDVPTAGFLGFPSDSTPAQSPVVKVKTIFERTGKITLDEPRQLFTQLDVLVHFDDSQTGWKEMTRWMKYEETVETGDRWSKPHVPTASLGALNKLRQAFAEKRCSAGFNVLPTTKSEYKVADAIMKVIKSGRHEDSLSDITSQRLVDVLTRPHKHKHRATVRTTHHTASRLQEQQLQRKALRREISVENPISEKSSVSSDEDVANGNGDVANHKKRKSPKKPLLRRRDGAGKDIASVLYSYPPGVKPDNLEPYKPNKKLATKLPPWCEAANIMIGQCNFLTDTIMAFCRLEHATFQADLTEVEVPTRFAFVLLGPPSSTSIWEFYDIGRAIAALLNDKVFLEVAYQATNADDIIAGIDEFMDGLTVLPPSIWDPSVPLEPPGKTMTMDKIKRRLSMSKRGFTGPESPHQEEGASDDMSLMRTGRFFGGLINDVRHRYKLYWSDIKDGFHLQCVASTIFLFFACITPIVTFGGLLGQKTDGLMGTMETLLSGAICGVTYALFSGQPLTIIGATGPLMIFESILYHLCKENGLDFMSFRFWIGMWILSALLVIVAFDMSALVRYITRFTEESFAILISVIFIVESFTKIFEIWEDSPVNVGVMRQAPNFGCMCSHPSVDSNALNESTEDTVWLWNSNDQWNATDTNATYLNHTSETWPAETLQEDCITNRSRLVVRYGCITEKDCRSHNWTLEGAACDIHTATGSVPDVFLLSFILFIGTFAVAMFFRNVRNGRYFPGMVKTTLADFAVLLAVVICTGVDAAFGLNTPKLNVPAEFKPTRPDRSWVINPAAVTYGWLIPLAAVPAVLGTILIFLDQQITAVIINRKEHKLVKGHGYHLDLLVIAILIGICSLLGLPWFVAATVRSITHVRSLIRQSDIRIPGERPQMLGVREQRLTGMCIHLLIGFSTLITMILRLIPMPVLYGVFLYMGITSLTGVQFIQRIGILLMPVKYQPDYIFLRHVKAIRVHAFTAIQVVCSVLMWVIKSIKTTSIAFPIMLIVLMAVRKLLDYVFTQSDLYWLDHLLPDELRRAKEDERCQQDDDDDDDDDDENAKRPAAESNNNEAEEMRVINSRRSSRSFIVEVGDQKTRKVSICSGVVTRH